jgi:hypothetical protein
VGGSPPDGVVQQAEDTAGQGVDGGTSAPGIVTCPTQVGGPPCIPFPVVSNKVDVSSKPSGSAIDAHFAGLSYDKGYLAKRPFFTAANADSVGLFKRLGPNHLRLGGGSCDDFRWTADGDAGAPRAGDAGTPLQITPKNVDDLAGFLVATGWDVLYCLNLASGTPEEAAAEAQHAKGALGSHLVGFEIGNEPQEYTNRVDPPLYRRCLNCLQSTTSPYQPDRCLVIEPGCWSPEAYATRWEGFAKAVRAAAPGVPLVGPAGGDIPWIQALLTEANGTLPLVSQHFYISNNKGPKANIPELLDLKGIPSESMGELDALVNKVGHGKIGWRMAETNTYISGGATGVSNAFAAALWAIDYMFAISAAHGTGVNFHSYGGHVSSPITDENDPDAGVHNRVTTVNALYYAMLFFKLAGTGVPLHTTLTGVKEPNLSAYAIRKNGGGTSVILLNKTASSISLDVDLGRAVSSASMLGMEAASLAATSDITIQGARVGVDGSFAPGRATPLRTSGTRVFVALKPASAALIDVP